MIEVGTEVKVTGGRWAHMGPWTVIKVNPTTYKLRNPGGQILNAAKTLCTEAPAEGERPPQRPEGIRAGAIVTHNLDLGPYEAGTLLVVIKDNYNELHVVPLGGDPLKPTRYWRISPLRVSVLDLASMARG